jgi:hypothetical protein
MAVNNPATGLASGESRAKPSAAERRPRCSASAPANPNAVPSANGSRLVANSVMLPTPNQSAPNRARRAPKCPTAIRSNSAVQATQETTSSKRTPTSHESGGASRL